jgi:hypothetical protein
MTLEVILLSQPSEDWDGWRVVLVYLRIVRSYIKVIQEWITMEYYR